MGTAAQYRVSPTTGAGFFIKKGQILQVTCYEDGQVGDLYCFKSGSWSECLSSVKTILKEDSILLGEGSLLYSNKDNPMFRIGPRGLFSEPFYLTPCSLKLFEISESDSGYHDGSHENLIRAFTEFGMIEDSVATSFNILMSVDISTHGHVTIRSADGDPRGGVVCLVAEMDLFVGLTACYQRKEGPFVSPAISYKII